MLLTNYYYYYYYSISTRKDYTCIIVYYFFKNNMDEERLGFRFPFEINQKRLGKNFKRSRVTAQFTRMERGQLFNYPGRTLSSKEYRVSFRRANGTHHNESRRLP